DTNAAPQLRQRLAQDTNPAVRRAALRALARFQDAETAPLWAAVVREAGVEETWRLEAVGLASQFPGADVSGPRPDLLQSGARADPDRSSPATGSGRRIFVRGGGG